MRGNDLWRLAAHLTFVSTCVALECYTCTQQDNNKEKCIKTTKQCEQYQDACVSEIRWAIPPYWTPRGNRIHYLSKDCDTSVNCPNRKVAATDGCVRDWYLDWYCVECCQGDLCNYYATLGSSRLRLPIWTTLATIFTALFVAHRFLWTCVLMLLWTCSLGL
jgi:hypothetical protein